MLNQSNMEITDQVLLDTASAFRNNVSKMRNLLNDATVNIDKTSSSWNSPAAEALREKYNRLKTVFEPFCENVEDFAEFLVASATHYVESEKKIEQVAQEALEDGHIGA